MVIGKSGKFHHDTEEGADDKQLVRLCSTNRNFKFWPRAQFITSINPNFNSISEKELEFTMIPLTVIQTT